MSVGLRSFEKHIDKASVLPSFLRAAKKRLIVGRLVALARSSHCRIGHVKL